ncbi:Uncharacterized protein APZ42_023109 [Daphnia magna]|uniref:Uncharacterized protein n=1 Tax=Daphnia magna TaxID=35525 RepID=A0A164V6I0_9CRUS|nr:Uncharacterized protein APZ42_023109 [Daphnia magna]
MVMCQLKDCPKADCEKPIQSAEWTRWTIRLLLFKKSRIVSTEKWKTASPLAGIICTERLGIR